MNQPPISSAATHCTFPTPGPSQTAACKFQAIFDTALKTYKRQTKQDLIAHPLATQLQACDSPRAILAILQGQADRFDRVQKGDERLKKWLNPTVSVLYALSGVFGEGISLVSIQLFVKKSDLTSIRQVFSPAKVIFAGVGVLLLVCNLVSLLVRNSVT